MALVGCRRQIRAPIAASSRSTTPRSSRTWSGPVFPAFTENTICCVLAPSTSWKYLRPSIPLSAPRRTGADQAKGPELELERVRRRERYRVGFGDRSPTTSYVFSIPSLYAWVQPVPDETDREVCDVDSDPAAFQTLRRGDRSPAPAEGVQDR